MEGGRGGVPDYGREEKEGRICKDACPMKCHPAGQLNNKGHHVNYHFHPHPHHILHHHVQIYQGLQYADSPNLINVNCELDLTQTKLN